MARTLFLRLYALANLRENKVLANKKCFTVPECSEIHTVDGFIFVGTNFSLIEQKSHICGVKNSWL